MLSYYQFLGYINECGINNSNSFDWAAFAYKGTQFSMPENFPDLRKYSSLEMENVWSETLHRICSCSKEIIKTAACMFRMLSVAVPLVNTEILFGGVGFSSRQSLDWCDHLQFWRECPAMSELLCTSGYSFDTELSLHPSFLMFLRSDRIKEGGLRSFYICLEEAQQEIAEACVTHLLQIELPGHTTGFSAYSGRYWHVHAADKPLYGSAKLDRAFQQRCIQLLDPHIPSFKYWTNLMTNNSSDFDYKKDYPQPLYYATLLGLYECARILLDDGAADPAASHPAAIYYCPFVAAVEKGRDKFVSLFIQYGSDANMIVDGCSPLFRAVKSGHLKVAEILLANDADLESKNDQEHTALHVACIEDRRWMIRPLLNAGADVEARDCWGNTPLSLAAAATTAYALQLLIDSGADIEARNGSGRTPLLQAINKNRFECAKLLIMKGADCRTQDTWGRTGFHLCDPYSPTLDLLLEKGANVDEEDGFGKTPLYCAVDNGNSYKVERLLEAGANPNPRRNDAVWSPLKAAIMRYREKEAKKEPSADLSDDQVGIISLLLGYGAKLEREWITAEWSESLRRICGISDQLG